MTSIHKRFAVACCFCSRISILKLWHKMGKKTSLTAIFPISIPHGIELNCTSLENLISSSLRHEDTLMRRSVLLPSEITQLTIIFAFKYGSCFITKMIIHFASCLQESRLNFLGPNNITHWNVTQSLIGACTCPHDTSLLLWTLY